MDDFSGKTGSLDASAAGLVRAELERVLHSAGFASAERLCEFLRFVVELTLAGHAGQLKETTVGVEVYHRDPGYDPRTEPIVRTEARRLRAKLDEYYAEAGSQDPVRIELPKGGYVARFAFATPLATEAEKLPTGPPTREMHEPDPQTGTSLTPMAAAPDQLRASPGRRSAKRWWLAAAFVAAAGVAFAFLHTGAPAALPVVAPLTSYPGYETEPALSPDGRQFAFVYDGDSGNFDIYVRFLDAGNPLRLTTDPAHDLHPTWSPDGRYIAFLRVSVEHQRLLVVPALGGSERQVAEITSSEGLWVADGAAMRHIGPSWSPDGKYLAISNQRNRESSGAIYLVAADSGAFRRLTQPPSDSIGDSMPVFSPDGRSLAFLRTASQRGITDIFTVAVAGGPETQITHDRKTVSGISWMGNNRLLFSSNRSDGNLLWRISASGGTPEAIAVAGRGVRQVSASADGSRVLYSVRVQNSNIWRIDLTARGQAPAEKFLASTGRNDSVQFSDDGKRLVFGSDRSGNYELWTANADGSNALQLTNFDGLPVGSPHWSPDGRQIVFDAVRDGRSVLYRINADGGQPQLFESQQGDAMMPTWSHDGQSIYFTERRQGEVRSLWKKPVNGGNGTEMLRDQTGDVLESADGKSTYFVGRPGGIWQAADDENMHRVAGLEDVQPSRYWAVTAKGIYFLNQAKAAYEIHFYDFAHGTVTPVARLSRPPALGTPSLTVSPDDHWLLYTQLDEVGSDVMMLTGLR